MNTTVEICIDLFGEDFELTVNFDYTPPERGHRDRFGCPLEPDYDEEIELCYVWDEDGDDILGGLKPKDKERIIEKIFEYREKLKDVY